MRELLSVDDVAMNLPKASKGAGDGVAARAFIRAVGLPEMRIGKRLYVRRADLAASLSIEPAKILQAE